jgi:hypothetical protein
MIVCGEWVEATLYLLFDFPCNEVFWYPFHCIVRGGGGARDRWVRAGERVMGRGTHGLLGLVEERRVRVGWGGALVGSDEG